MRIFLACALACFSLAAFGDEYKGLKITAEVNTPKYKRSLYNHWIDADGDNEDARQEVLIAESLTEPALKIISGDSRVQSGLWAAPYCGYVTTDPGTLDVDHMVPLKEVHLSGGYKWPPEKREAYANDLSDSKTLIAVKAGCNRSKGFKDPADWLPPNRAYWCTYLTEWVAIKQKWQLTMDQAEVDAVKEGFRVCGKYKAGDELAGRH